MEKNFIDGKDAGVFVVVIFVVVIPPNNNISSIGIETYTVINGMMAYQFAWAASKLRALRMNGGLKHM